MQSVNSQPGGLFDADPMLAITVVVPCRNEGDHIEACVRSIVGQQDVAGGFEVIVVDGMSDDGTRAALDRLASEFANLTVADNPRRITPVAMNIGIRRARGANIAILGAHSVYDPHYLATCLQLLEEHPEVSGVGGPIRSRGKTLFGRAVARAMSHPLGIGNARHRYPDFEGYAEGACFPMYRREVFERYGLFDERLVRNQDDEFYLRLTRAGERTYLSPRAVSEYYVRSRPGALYRQYYQYGRWRRAVMRIHGQPMSLRQLVPSFFYGLLVLLALIGPWLPGPWRWLAAGLAALYLAVLMLGGLFIAVRDSVAVGVRFVAAAAILHLAYAMGFARGIPLPEPGPNGSERV